MKSDNIQLLVASCEHPLAVRRQAVATNNSQGATAGLSSSAFNRCFSTGGQAAPGTRWSFETATNNSQLTTRRSRGITLIELLVVIFILTILTAAVVPTLTPNVEDRRLREAVRGVTAFISGARSRAIGTGRPYGVVIERMENERGASMRLSYAEVPPPFDGLADDSVVRCMSVTPSVGSTPGNARFVFGFGSTFIVELFPTRFVVIDDQIQFNNQGRKYRIIDVENRSGTDLVEAITVEIPVGIPTPPWRTGDPSIATTVPYRVLRQPIRRFTDSDGTKVATMRSGAAPYQLPDGVVIDLFASSVGDSVLSFFHAPNLPSPNTNDNDDPIVIMFSPNGSLAYVQRNSGLPASGIDPPQQLNQPVSLLIGKRENVAPPPGWSSQTDENTNWLDLNNRWVTISPRTGQVGTSRLAAYIQPSTLPPLDEDRITNAIWQSRRFAREMGSLGGN